MAITIHMTPQTRALLAKLETTWGKERLYKEIEQFFGRRAQIIAGAITRDFLSGQRLRRRTGSLARSVVGMSVRVGGAPAIKVGVLRGPATAYAAIQEFGGEIKPKNAKALAIPKEDVLTDRGVDRYGGPRKHPHLTFIPFKRQKNAIGALLSDRQLALLREEGDFRRIKIAYLLVRRAKIKAKHWLRDGFLAGIANVGQDLAEFLRRQLMPGAA